MKKTAVFALLIAFALLLCASCVKKLPEEQMPVFSELSSFTVCYEAEDKLVPISVNEKWDPDILSTLLKKLCVSSAELENTGLCPVLPTDCAFNVSVKNGTANIDINCPSIDSLTEGKAKNIVSSVTAVATQFSGINSVNLSFNGNAKKLGATDISLPLENAQLNPAYDLGSLSPFTVYYSLKDSEYVVPVTKAARTIDAKTVVEAMIKEPKDKKYVSLFPSGTKLLSAEVKDGSLILNFSKELSSLNDTPEKRELLFKTLSYALNGLSGIDKAQILAEGKSVCEIPVLSGVFSNNAEVLQAEP